MLTLLFQDLKSFTSTVLKTLAVTSVLLSPFFAEALINHFLFARSL